jgi:hypothetical protein
MDIWTFREAMDVVERRAMSMKEDNKQIVTYHQHHWFKHRHLNIYICFVEGKKISKEQGLANQACNSFYQNIQALYN